MFLLQLIDKLDLLSDKTMILLSIILLWIRILRIESSCTSCSSSDGGLETCNDCKYGGSCIDARCNCQRWTTGDHCEICYSIPNCEGAQLCGEDGVKCSNCKKQFYLDGSYTGGNTGGCQECRPIDNCIERQCTSSSDTACLTCQDENIFFKKTTSNRQCERMCTWNNHYCWPGTCSDGLVRNCLCSPNFSESSTELETNCQPIISPTILICDTHVIGRSGQLQSIIDSTNISRRCQPGDMFGNFQLSKVTFTMTSEFRPYKENLTKPNFVQYFKIGISDATISITKESIKGLISTLSTYPHIGDYVPTYTVENEILLNNALYNMENGERMCVVYEASGDGYITGFDTQNSRTVDQFKYTKRTMKQERCYVFDTKPPVHCSESFSCYYQPIQLSAEITRIGSINVTLLGWGDPLPSRDSEGKVSPISSYQLNVYEVVVSLDGTLKIDSYAWFNMTLPATILETSVVLASAQPRLFCIVLEVKDLAGNFRKARQFVLNDNTSSVEVLRDNPITVISATAANNYTWQTHHHICLSWKNHFRNTFYYSNHLLGPIEPDAQGLISGAYEDHEGVLQVTGTSNVHGIVQFFISWKIDSNMPSEEISVPDFQRQLFCVNVTAVDGQSYTFIVRAVDIVNNTCDDTKTLYIDTSVPHLDNVLITANQNYSISNTFKSESLSELKILFEAFDGHSGLQSIDWRLILSDFGMIINSGLALVQYSNEKCSNETPTCYCPKIGKCEFKNYSILINNIPFSKFPKQDNNTEYTITCEIKVTNKAMLSNETSIRFQVLYSHENTNNALNIGAIVGGILGAVIVLAIIIVGLFKFRKYHILDRIGSICTSVTINYIQILDASAVKNIDTVI